MNIKVVHQKQIRITDLSSEWTMKYTLGTFLRGWLGVVVFRYVLKITAIKQFIFITRTIYICIGL